MAGSSARATITSGGISTVSVRALDQAGNISALATRVVKIDPRAPNSPSVSVTPTPNAAG